MKFFNQFEIDDLTQYQTMANIKMCVWGGGGGDCCVVLVCVLGSFCVVHVCPTLLHPHPLLIFQWFMKGMFHKIFYNLKSVK